MTSNVFDLDVRDMTYAKLQNNVAVQPNGLLYWMEVHWACSILSLGLVENNQPIWESLKALSARALGVAHSGNKYSTEAASLSVKLRALDNCFPSAIFDTRQTLLKQTKKHFTECYLTLNSDLHRT
jgi:hypothetical protein